MGGPTALLLPTALAVVASFLATAAALHEGDFIPTSRRAQFQQVASHAGAKS
jgi:hypothetical protein